LFDDTLQVVSASDRPGLEGLRHQLWDLLTGDVNARALLAGDGRC